MSSLILPNGLTMRHDGYLGMIYDWALNDQIAKATIGQGLANEAALVAAAEQAREAGQGKKGLSEVDAAHILLGLFLVNRKVRRQIAKVMERAGQLEDGQGMRALNDLKTELETLVFGAGN